MTQADTDKELPSSSAPPSPPRSHLVARTSARVRHSRERHPVVWRFGCTLLAVCIALLVTSDVSNSANFNIATGAAAAIVILGLSFLTGYSGQVSLGNGAFFGVGAYTFVIFANHQSSSNMVEDLLVATGAGALAGLIVGLPATRLRGPYLAGMTIAVAISFTFLVSEFATWTNGDEGLDLQGTIGAPQWLAHLIGAKASSQRATGMWRADIVIVVTGIAFFLMANLFKSRTGRAMRLMREHDVAAELVGVNLPVTRVTAFVVAAACAGLGGGLTMLFTTTVGINDYGLALSIELLALLVIGGIGTISGALIGGLLYAYSFTWITWISNSIGVNQSSNLGSSMNNIIYGALLILCVLVAPMGIAGTTRFVIFRRLQRRRSPD